LTMVSMPQETSCSDVGFLPSFFLNIVTVPSSMAFFYKQEELIFQLLNFPEKKNSDTVLRFVYR
jgi:hypothetical protein